MKKIAVVSMSGGLDSTCLALDLMSRGYEVRAYAFDYGQRHSLELKKLKRNVWFMMSLELPISLQIINLRDVFSESCSCLNNREESVPKSNYSEENMKSTVVENRNIIFSSIIYSKALSISKREDTNVVISLGIHSGDHSLYPDTTKESRDAAEHAFKISNWGSERISYETPFVELNKKEVLQSGIEAMNKLGLSFNDSQRILSLTHSCYDPNDKGESCGTCGTCVERLEAFKSVEIEDPIKYSR